MLPIPADLVAWTNLGALLLVRHRLVRLAAWWLHLCQLQLAAACSV